MPSKQHPDYKYIQALLDNDSEKIKTVYQRFLPQCITFVKKNSGTKEDAKDIFQKSLLAITLHVRKRPEFVLTAPFGGFLYRFYQRLWLRELQRRRGDDDIINGLQAYIDNDSTDTDPEVFDEISKDQKRLNKLLGLLKELSEICQTIIKLTFWGDLKPREIAPRLGVSANFISVRKKRCLKELKNRM